MSEDTNNSKKPWKWGDEIWINPVKGPSDSDLDGTRYLAYGYDAQMKPFDKGDWVRYDDYARLKTEVEKLEHQVNYWKIEAEVDNARWLRVLEENARLKANDSIIIQAQVSAGKSVVHYIAEIENLKAQVKRLTKAGDLLCRMAGNNQVINRHWKTAKKGVQS